MKDVTLGYKAFDLHELTCHVVARHTGLYADRGLEVSLLDTRRVTDKELPDSVMSVACGSALLRWLRGEPVKVVFIAATRPMFWLVCREDVTDLQDLAGGRIAGYPTAAPPAQFLRVVLDEAGLGSAGAVTVLPAGDDTARLDMLQSGEAVAALLSSATSARAVEQAGFRRLFCLGDRIQVPTTGLAVHPRLLADDPDVVERVREAFGAALRVIHTDAAVLRESFRAAAIVDDSVLDEACLLVRQFYSDSGVMAAADIMPDVQRLAKSMGQALTGDVGDLYPVAAALPRVESRQGS